jgi:hypothetical protein
MKKDLDLNRCINSIGKGCFIKHFDLFADRKMRVIDKVDKLMGLENYTESGCHIRVTFANQIFDSGNEREVLRLIIDSPKVTWNDKQKAKQILLTLK